ncbi:hypothetical protein IC762_30125 [Bradyrhizobium genosp. L]|uniref:hypothetical protein n=1 Tax=Bradyrhizobium genosp. L TaxID=83637 RepID=UPI0018A33963|nr:hypothetical protein [Bradyrhizobium genosp. L]QPF83880.1 hypothetical protein IC762_30125 [Bradyrhizobium genosp. L]
MLDDEFNRQRSILIRNLADKADDPFIKRRLLDLISRYEQRPVKAKPLSVVPLGWPDSSPPDGEAG